MEEISNCPLFKGISAKDIDKLIGGMLGIRQFSCGTTILRQGEEYLSLLIIIEGEVCTQMTDMNGRNVIIETISAPNIIAPAILFASDNRMPVNVVVQKQLKVIPISKDNFTYMLGQNNILLSNFLQNISDRGKFLSEKVRLLRFGTIKSKISGYLLEIVKNKQCLEFEIKHSQQELADMFGVTRPALAKAIKQMIDEGLITSHQKHYKIINTKELSRLFKESINK